MVIHNAKIFVRQCREAKQYLPDAEPSERSKLRLSIFPKEIKQAAIMRPRLKITIFLV